MIDSPQLFESLVQSLENGVYSQTILQEWKVIAAQYQKGNGQVDEDIADVVERMQHGTEETLERICEEVIDDFGSSTHSSRENPLQVLNDEQFMLLVKYIDEIQSVVNDSLQTLQLSLRPKKSPMDVQIPRNWEHSGEISGEKSGQSGSGSGNLAGGGGVNRSASGVSSPVESEAPPSTPTDTNTSSYSFGVQLFVTPRVQGWLIHRLLVARRVPGDAYPVLCKVYTSLVRTRTLFSFLLRHTLTSNSTPHNSAPHNSAPHNSATHNSNSTGHNSASSNTSTGVFDNSAAEIAYTTTTATGLLPAANVCNALLRGNAVPETRVQLFRVVARVVEEAGKVLLFPGDGSGAVVGAINALTYLCSFLAAATGQNDVIAREIIDTRVGVIIAEVIRGLVNAVWRPVAAESGSGCSSSSGVGAGSGGTRSSSFADRSNARSVAARLLIPAIYAQMCVYRCVYDVILPPSPSTPTATTTPENYSSTTPTSGSTSGKCCNNISTKSCPCADSTTTFCTCSKDSSNIYCMCATSSSGTYCTCGCGSDISCTRLGHCRRVFDSLVAGMRVFVEKRRHPMWESVGGSSTIDGIIQLLFHLTYYTNPLELLHQLRLGLPYLTESCNNNSQTIRNYCNSELCSLRLEKYIQTELLHHVELHPMLYAYRGNNLHGKGGDLRGVWRGREGERERERERDRYVSEGARSAEGAKREREGEREKHASEGSQNPESTRKERDGERARERENSMTAAWKAICWKLYLESFLRLRSTGSRTLHLSTEIPLSAPSHITTSTQIVTSETDALNAVHLNASTQIQGAESAKPVHLNASTQIEDGETAKVAYLNASTQIEDGEAVKPEGLSASTQVEDSEAMNATPVALTVPTQITSTDPEAETSAPPDSSTPLPNPSDTIPENSTGVPTTTATTTTDNESSTSAAKSLSGAARPFDRCGISDSESAKAGGGLPGSGDVEGREREREEPVYRDHQLGCMAAKALQSALIYERSLRKRLLQRSLPTTSPLSPSSPLSALSDTLHTPTTATSGPTGFTGGITGTISSQSVLTAEIQRLQNRIDDFILERAEMQSKIRQERHHLQQVKEQHAAIRIQSQHELQRYRAEIEMGRQEKVEVDMRLDEMKRVVRELQSELNRYSQLELKKKISENSAKAVSDMDPYVRYKEWEKSRLNAESLAAENEYLRNSVIPADRLKIASLEKKLDGTVQRERQLDRMLQKHSVKLRELQLECQELSEAMEVERMSYIKELNTAESEKERLHEKIRILRKQQKELEHSLLSSFSLDNSDSGSPISSPGSVSPVSSSPTPASWVSGSSHPHARAPSPAQPHSTSLSLSLSGSRHAGHSQTADHHHSHSLLKTHSRSATGNGGNSSAGGLQVNTTTEAIFFASPRSYSRKK